MTTILFTAHFGDHTKQVEISQPSGNGGGGYFVMIDRYYQGTITKIQGEWVWHHNKPNFFMMDDIQVLGEILDEGLTKPL